MQVNLNPNITTNYNRQQNPNFKAVNMKWAKEIIEDPDYICDELCISVGRKVDPKDFIDTLEYTMDKVGDGFRKGVQHYIDWAKANFMSDKKSA